MNVLRAGLEQVLLLLLRFAQTLFLLQAMAAACAFLAVQAFASEGMPDWLRSTLTSVLLIAVSFAIAGVLMSAARHRAPSTAAVQAAHPASGWPLLLGLSLVAVSAMALVAAQGLPAVWSQIGIRLDAAGFWGALQRSDPFGGIVLLPILAVLVVPALTTGAAAFSIVFPLGLLPQLAARSPLFPSLLLRGTICQAALLLAGWFALDALSELASQATASMNASGDAGVATLSAELDGAVTALHRTAVALVPSLGVMVLWAIVLRPSGGAAAQLLAGDAGMPAADVQEGVHKLNDPRSI